MAVAYLYLQGALCVLWWLLLCFVPTTRVAFLPDGFPEEALLGFWLADLVGWTAGSWFAAYTMQRDSRWRSFALGCATAGVGYPTLTCMGTALITHSGWLGAALMTPALCLTIVIALRHPTHS